MRIAYILSALSNILVISTLPLTLSVYNVSDEARALGATLIMIHTGCAIFLWPSAFVMPQCLKAGGDATFTLVISVASMWVFRILLSYIIGGYFGLGAIGVFISMVIDWIFRASMFLWRFHSRKWIHKSLAEKA